MPHTDLDRSTVSRVINGVQHPGPALIGGALTALAPKQFVDLFDIVVAEPRPTRG